MWSCCRCNNATPSYGVHINSFGNQSPTLISLGSLCECSHERCNECTFEDANKTLSGNHLLEGFHAESQKPKQESLHAWRCCECHEGPFDYIELQWERHQNVEEKQQCIGFGCGHRKCPRCIVYTGYNVDGTIYNLDQINWKRGEVEVLPWENEYEAKSSDMLQVGVFEPMMGLLGEDTTISPQHLAHCQMLKVSCQEKYQKARRQVLQRKAISRGSEALEFLLAWEYIVIPFLSKFLSELDPAFTISFRQATEPNHRIVEVMTGAKLSEIMQETVSREISRLFPLEVEEIVNVEFSTGRIQKSGVAACQDQLDDICLPKNPGYHQNPTMGDSIGLAQGQGDDDNASTLGPCLVIDGKDYWLMNYHPLHKAAYSREINQVGDCTGLKVEHPSPRDRITCGISETSLDDKYFTIGTVDLSSGNHWGATARSRNQYWEDLGLDPQEIVIDWALITATRGSINYRRQQGCLPYVEIKDTTEVQESTMSYSVGRTSGFQLNKICHSPMVVSGAMNETGKITREWYVMNPGDCTSEKEWTVSGTGIGGDSGAGIIDLESNALCGQVWGRNWCKKEDQGPRYTFFTPISDVFRNIQDRYRENYAKSVYPQLAVARHEVLEPMTPMMEMIRGEDATPAGTELLTPQTIASPEHVRVNYQRDRLLGLDNLEDSTLQVLSSPYPLVIDTENDLNIDMEEQLNNLKRDRPCLDTADDWKTPKRIRK